jgi:hypothetical protein
VRQRNLIAIVLISAILLSSTFPYLSAATGTVGQTNIGSYSAWQPAGVMIGSRITASGGTPISMHVHITQSVSLSNTAKCAIYSESNKQLIAVTEEKTIPAGFNGWLSFNFASASSLTSGSSYSLVVWLKNSGTTVRYNYASTTQTWYTAQSYSGNFPNGPYTGLSGYGQERNVYSIYATLDFSTNSAPTPTPPPTTQVSSNPPVSSSTFGKTTIGSYSAWQPGNLMLGSRFTATTTGTLNSITVYLTNGASSPNNVKAAIYSETNRALVASTQEITINGKASGWFTFPTSTSPTIAAGQRYSLVIWFKNAGCQLSYASGSSSQSWYKNQIYGNYASTYDINSHENNVYSLYATITPTGTTSSTTTQTLNPTYIPASTSKPQTSAKGELYLWVGHWMYAGDTTTKRIATARDSSGINIWVDAGNWGGPHLTSSLINYFHSHGVKVVCRLWSGGGRADMTPLAEILHGGVSNGRGGSVDYQMRIGPEIDAFMIDECDQRNTAYYTAIADYVHSKGKLLFVNPGTHNISPQTLKYADKVSTEHSWYQFVNSPHLDSLRTAHPQKFIGISQDYAYDIGFPYMPPTSASGDRPAYHKPMSEQRAVWETKTGWAGGVYSMFVTSREHGFLPTWWEQYIANLRY